MRNGPVFTEIIFTAVEPERAFRTADECLVTIRIVESRKEAAAWIHEYEVSGEFGKIEKFRGRIRSIEPA
ncbi:hypothetical protein EDC14_1002115 [Hydrogenispora ethanolica]|jgi:hypothetical protein|uniref:Uncharacterized protein n=1 Tax=Hydrogenispora ethanolica TaxID=1082276 RepID=A0A4R1SA93_HYDET|nr:hypothetical protein [Hydrogenispora ethanolica]TCL76358.1 hypothetical protein EDC14_1002115 [Hydrogenispora ethanolica]